jgi:hypothetical protein
MENMAKRKVRIRSKRLDEIDELKLSLAIYLMAQDLVEDKTTPPSFEDDGGEPDESGAAA